jgi:hypothetical protein
MNISVSKFIIRHQLKGIEGEIELLSTYRGWLIAQSKEIEFPHKIPYDILVNGNCGQYTREEIANSLNIGLNIFLNFAGEYIF